jgi:hypothetical protein
VLRAAGSTRMLAAGNSGRSRRIVAVCEAPATVKTSRAGMSGSTRSSVSRIMAVSPAIGRNCLGARRRLSGQNRVPLPPAMMTALRSGAPAFIGPAS